MKLITILLVSFLLTVPALSEEEKIPEYPKLDPKALKEKLPDLSYRVTQESATERAFTGEYWDETRAGLYVDITTGEPLFFSFDKFDSGCGWPSFVKPISEELIREKDDYQLGYLRREVRSRSGDAHLGHVFTDGPRDRGGLRYCINSASLRFIPREDMEKEGYGYLIERFNRELAAHQKAK